MEHEAAKVRLDAARREYLRKQHEECTFAPSLYKENEAALSRGGRSPLRRALRPASPCAPSAACCRTAAHSTHPP